jgi:hypothetical protein
MTRSLLMILAAALAWAQAPPSVEGDWQGTLTAGPSSLRLVFHITKGSDGLYLGQLDSLDQGSRIPIDRIQVTGDSVRFELKAVNGMYEGAFGADGHLKGTWSQGAPLPLELTRMSPAAAAAAKPTPTYWRTWSRVSACR